VTSLDGFDPIALDEAVHLLVAESKMEGDLSEVATMLGCEPPVLKWAASLARTIGCVGVGV
jgi:hypothetical protein